MIDVRLADRRDAEQVIERLRPADVQELWALDLMSPEKGVVQSIALTDAALAARVVSREDPRGYTIAVFGIAGDLVTGHGQPWFLGTPECRLHGRRLIRGGRNLLADGFRRGYRQYSGLVYVHNSPAIRYLAALGFTFTAATSPRTGADALMFTMEAPGV